MGLRDLDIPVLEKMVRDRVDMLEELKDTDTYLTVLCDITATVTALYHKVEEENVDESA